MDNTDREKNEDDIWEISAKEVQENLNKLELIDVRSAEEYEGELGHIEGAVLSTLQTDLAGYLKELDPAKTYVFVCRSGRRSSEAALMAKAAGIEDVYNLVGGMIAWNRKGFPLA